MHANKTISNTFNALQIVCSRIWLYLTVSP